MREDVCVDVQVKFPCRIRANHRLTDQPFSVRTGGMSAAAFEVGALFPASVEVEVGVEWVDLHTKLFSPPLCSCAERGESNCLHQSEVFISAVSAQIWRDVGRRQRNAEWK